MGADGRLWRTCTYLARRLVAPLKTDEAMKNFTLAIPEAQTTTVDSVQGRAMRPPAVLECRGCESAMVQHNALDRIDCPNCWRDFSADAVGDLDLHSLICPRCETEMDHGIRHHELFDTPEWATCPNCQYHWDLDHWF